MSPAMPNEIIDRIKALYNKLCAAEKNWDAALIVDKLNQFYFTGTMQDAILVLKANGEYTYFVRNNFDNARAQSGLENIVSMTSYRDLLSFLNKNCSTIYVEANTITQAILTRLNQHFNFQQILPMDNFIYALRAVKSAHELSLMQESGKQHAYLLENIVPKLLKEKMSEAALTAAMYKEMIGLGYHGVTRFSQFQAEMILGQIGFGESSLVPVAFDGPGGNRGICPAVPTIGSRERLLKKGDLVFVDIGYGVGGYHTDKTQLYMFGESPSAAIVAQHRECIKLQKKMAQLLCTGSIPEKIYDEIIADVDTNLLPNFMSFGNKKVKFLGHGIGLQIDEYPVIAQGFTEPLATNMTLALEPKNGVAGVGLLGVEDTYVVTPNGGISLTGEGQDIMVV